MWPWPKSPKLWTHEAIDKVLAAVRHFKRDAICDEAAFERERQKWHQMLAGTPVVGNEVTDMADSVAKCFDTRSPMIRMLDSPCWRRTVAEPSRETVSALREETVAPKLRLYSDCPTGLCSTPISCAANSRCRALNAQARCQCSVPQGIGRICSWCGLPWRHG